MFFNFKKKTKNKLALALVVMTALFSLSFLVNIDLVLAQGSADPSQAEAAVGNQSTQEQTQINEPCGIRNIGACFMDGFKALLEWLISSVLLVVLGWILWLAGAMMDYILEFSVVDMRAQIDGLSAINLTWSVFRDIANMAFIWILLYIAISTILGMDTGRTKSLLVKVIIVALLLNFSLFFTKIVIDASNILTIQFYDSILQSAPEGTRISHSIMNSLGLPTAFDSGSTLSNQIQSGEFFYTLLINTLFACIIILVTAFVLFAVSGLFVLRYVMYIFLLILSPLAITAMILPGTQKYFQKWLDALLDQSIFAPAFMALLWVSLTVLGGVTTQTLGVFSDASSATPGFVEITMNYVIIIVLLIASMVLAKTMASRSSGKLGETMMKFGRTSSGFVATRTAGRGAAAIDKRLSETRFGNTGLGAAIRSPFTRASKARWGGAESGKNQQKDAVDRKTTYAKLSQESEGQRIDKKGRKGEKVQEAKISEMRRGYEPKIQEAERRGDIRQRSSETAYNNVKKDIEDKYQEKIDDLGRRTSMGEMSVEEQKEKVEEINNKKQEDLNKLEERKQKLEEKIKARASKPEQEANERERKMREAVKRWAKSKRGEWIKADREKVARKVEGPGRILGIKPIGDIQDLAKKIRGGEKVKSKGKANIPKGMSADDIINLLTDAQKADLKDNL